MQKPLVVVVAAMALLAGILALVLATWHGDPHASSAVPAPGPDAPGAAAKEQREETVHHRDPQPVLHEPAPAAGGTALDAAEHAWSIAVVDARSQPIGGAAVAAIDTRCRILGQGIADEHGALTLVLPADVVPTTLVAKAEGHATGRRTLPPAPNGVERVVLEDAAQIAGYVTLQDGSPAPAGTRVFAWTTVSQPGAEAFRQPTRAGVPMVESSQVEPDGYFVLREAAASKAYTLAAGGGGWTCLQPARRVRAGGDLVRLVLSRVHGCVVEAVFPDGSSPPPSRLFTLDYGVPEREDMTMLSHPSLQLALAGIDDAPDPPDGLQDWRRHVLAVAIPREEPRIDGFRLTYEVLGIERTIFGLALPPVSGALERRTATVRPTALGFGSLTIAMEGGIDLGDHLLGRSYVTAKVEFRPLSENLVPIQADVAHIRNGEVRIEGIPVGRYEIRLLAPGGLVHPPVAQRSIVDVTAAGSEWKVPIDTLGALRFTVLNPDADRRGHTLALSLQRPDQEKPWTFLVGPPYLVTGLREGEFLVTVAATGREPKQTAGPFRVRIARRSITNVAFGWQDE